MSKTINFTCESHDFKILLFLAMEELRKHEAKGFYVISSGVYTKYQPTRWAMRVDMSNSTAVAGD